MAFNELFQGSNVLCKKGVASHEIFPKGFTFASQLGFAEVGTTTNALTNQSCCKEGHSPLARSSATWNAACSPSAPCRAGGKTLSCFVTQFLQAQECSFVHAILAWMQHHVHMHTNIYTTKKLDRQHTYPCFKSGPLKVALGNMRSAKLV